MVRILRPVFWEWGLDVSELTERLRTLAISGNVKLMAQALHEAAERINELELACYPIRLAFAAKHHHDDDRMCVMGSGLRDGVCLVRLGDLRRISDVLRPPSVTP